MLTLAGILGSLMDPIAIIIGAIIAIVARAWWHVAIAAIVVGVLLALLISQAVNGSAYATIMFAIDCIIWAGAIFGLKRIRQRHRAAN